MIARSRLAFSAFFTALGCWAGACSPAAEPPPLPAQHHVFWRFIEQPAAALWSPRSLIATEEVAEWRLGEPKEHAAWTVRHADLRDEAVGVGLALRGSGRHLQLARRVDLQAEQIDALEVGLDTSRGVSVALEWAGPGEPFSAERRIAVPPQQITSGPESSARFDVGSHPAWKGEIRRLRIALGVPVERPVMVRRVVAQRTRRDREALVAATSRDWLLDLGGEARPALLAPPGLVLEREIEILAQARLGFGYAAPPAAPGPVGFRILFVPDGAAEDAVPEEIFAAELAPDAGGRWHDAEVDLGRLAGRRGRLRLVTELAASYDPFSHGFPAWSSLEAVAPAGSQGRTVESRRLPNVVLISIDTLRADRLSLYGNPRPTSPHLDAWAASRATVFETAVASAPWTLPAHTTLLTGIDAHRHGINYDYPAAPALDTLAERLRRAGYRTLAVTGGGFLDPEYGLAQGFDRYFHYTRRLEAREEELDSGIAQALALLRESPDRPFFLFFHSYEVHAPYHERQPFFEQLTGYRAPFSVEPVAGGAPAQPGSLNDKPLRAVKPRSDEASAGDPPRPSAGAPELTPLAHDLYDASIAFTDDRLRLLFAALDDLGLADGTAVVFTADHGEMLGEHGLAGHQYLYDPNLLVPLVIAPPASSQTDLHRRAAGRRVARQVRQADVVPTVLDLAGLPVPAEIDGRSLVPLMEGGRADLPDVAISYAGRSRRGASLRTVAGVKHVRRTTAWTPLAGETRSFDLLADPGESAPRPGDRRLDRRLRAELAEAYAGLLLEIEAGERGLAVELRGDSISLRRLHSVDADCECVTWQAEGRARIEAPAGARIALRLEDPAGTELEVRVEIPGSGPDGRSRARFGLAEAQPQRLEWNGASWREGSSSSAAAHGPSVELGWRGGLQDKSGGNVSEGNAEVRRQLRALGYL